MITRYCALEGDLAAKRAAIEDVLGDHSKVEILGGKIIASPMARDMRLVIVQSASNCPTPGPLPAGF